MKKNIEITNVENTDKKLIISDVSDSLFNQLKLEMIEYCLDNEDTSLDDEIQYYIKQYKKYNERRKIDYVV